jgi:hypothetical protein
MATLKTRTLVVAGDHHRHSPRCIPTLLPLLPSNITDQICCRRSSSLSPSPIPSQPSLHFLLIYRIISPSPKIAVHPTLPSTLSLFVYLSLCQIRVVGSAAKELAIAIIPFQSVLTFLLASSSVSPEITVSRFRVVTSFVYFIAVPESYHPHFTAPDHR